MRLCSPNLCQTTFLPFSSLYHRWVLLAHKGTQVGKQMVLKDITATVDITSLPMFAASQFSSSPFFIPYPPDYWSHHLHLLVDGYMGSVIQGINHKAGRREHTTECWIWQNAKIDKRLLFFSIHFMSEFIMIKHFLSSYCEKIYHCNSPLTEIGWKQKFT